MQDFCCPTICLLQRTFNGGVRPVQFKLLYEKFLSVGKDTFSIFVCMHAYASSVNYHLCLKLASVFH